MDLKHLQHQWEGLGDRDPLWAILSNPDKQDGRWDLDEFFSTGKHHMAYLVSVLESHGMPTRFSSALDFGCGVGRLTQALCEYAERVVGVDIAETMVDQARQHNRFGERCRYEVNTRGDLGMFADGEFDLVHSTLVLQHMHPVLQRGYLHEFMRVLAPGGVGMIQMASDYWERDVGPNCLRTAARGPLPEGACRASVATVASYRLEAWQLAELRVWVTNQGQRPWPAVGDHEGRFRVKLGSRWRDANNGVVFEDQRTLLANDLPAGERVNMALRIAAPGEPGHYRLEVDMIQEDAGWFSERGSEPFVVDVEVCEKDDESGKDRGIEMYCVPRREVIALLHSAGATDGFVKDVPPGPGELVGHQYWLKK